MPISLGDPVPAVQVPSYVRGRRNARLAGTHTEHGRWVVLAFYPRNFDSDCISDLVELAELAPTFASEDTALLGASTGSWLSHRRWFDHTPALADVRYPILADSAHELSTAFGTLQDDGRCRRAMFLIDPAGVLRHVSGDNGRPPSAFEMLRRVRSLRSQLMLRAA